MEQPTDPAAGGISLDTLADEQAAAAPITPDVVVPGYPFEWGGREWRLKPQFDVRAVAALQSGEIGRALGLMLGKEQAKELLAWDPEDESVVFSDDVLAQMIQTCGSAGGLTLGESSASQTS